MMANLQCRLLDHVLPSPLILASGPRSYDAQGIWAAFEAGAAGVTTKTIRLKAAVNPTPHIVTTHAPSLRNTLFNSEQWSDLPWERWVEHELPALAGHPGVLIASVGHTPQEVERMVKPMVSTGVVDIVECVAYASSSLAPMVRAIRKETDLPILAKLSYNWGEQLIPMAETALQAGASGFTAMDSIGPTLQIDIETGQSLHGGRDGKAWMSGAAIKPVALALVAELVQQFGLPVVATGGIVSGEDVIESLMAGASAVGACTAPLIRGLDWFRKTSATIDGWLEAHGHGSLEDIRGAALPLLPRADHTQRLAFRFDPASCTLCHLCEVVCAYEAREVAGEVPRSPTLEMLLDEAKCRSCGLCVDVCKPGALTYANWPPRSQS